MTRQVTAQVIQTVLLSALIHNSRNIPGTGAHYRVTSMNCCFRKVWTIAFILVSEKSLIYVMIS